MLCVSVLESAVRTPCSSVERVMAGRERAAADGGLIAGDWTLAALGGYGRGRLAPSSDIDLTLVHRDLRKPEVDRLVQALFYPLWDRGLELSHTVRSVKESVSFGREDLEWLTSTLSARFIAGEPELLAEFSEAMTALSRAKNGRPFFDKVMAKTVERRRCFGDAGRLREPQIKDGRGGLRDIQAVYWLTRGCIADAASEAGDEFSAAVSAGLLPPGDRAALESAEEFLWELRVVLHELAGRDQNQITAEFQLRLARRLFPDEADCLGVLGRSLYQAVRDVGAISDEFFAALEGRLQSGWRQSRLSPGRVGTRDGPLTFSALQSVLGRGFDGLEELECLARSGELERIVTEWSVIKGLSFADPNHRHPVDTHSFITVGELAAFGEPGKRDKNTALSGGVDRRLAVRLSSELAHPDWLLLAGLFHDIGKGRGGVHAEVGADIFAGLGPRLGLDRHALETIGWLIRYHLLLSHTATRRDLDDPRVVDGVAAMVGDGDRLRMLYLLTLADALATGPNAWNSWRSTLIDELFIKTLKSLEGESGDESSNQIRMTEKHFELLEGDAETAVAFWPGENGLGELAVVAPDSFGLISRIAGVLALNRINVLAAGLYTTDDGRALEVFRIAAAFESEVTDEMYVRIKEDIGRALSGRMALSYRVDELSRRYERKGRDREPARIVFDNEASEEFTVIEVHAPDALGVLYEVTGALVELNLDIHFAKASTFGDRAVDAFYVRDLDGSKVIDDSYLKEIEKNILFKLSRFS